MIDKSVMYNVTNRSGSTVCYSIPEMNNLRRTFAAGESKRLSYEELEKLTYIPGGLTLISNYLLIKEADVIENLGIHAEPEYHLNRDEVVKLMLTGSLDAFLDCLDFAPEGVLQIIKDAAVELPLNDVQKRDAIKEKLGFDVSAAIANNKESANNEIIADKPGRRVKETAAAPAPARRVDTPEYKVVNTQV